MSRNHQRTLTQKLILIGLVTAASAILLAITLMLAAEFVAYRSSMVSDLMIKAEIIGNQCTAALTFNVKKDAEETLSSLRADRDIEYAAVYTVDGNLFAHYRRSNMPEQWFAMQHPEGYQFGIDHLTVFRNITLQNGKQFGAVSIRSDLHKFRVLLFRYLATAGFVLVVALLIAYVLMARLQQTITRPVTDLVQMMDGIARNGDYAVRVVEAGEDELAALARGFNAMLSTIEDRDRELEARRRDLERSLTDLKHSSEELLEANRKLRDLDKLKSEFISVASHELRTPLTSIKAFAELMLMKQEMSKDRKNKLLGIINTESDRLTRLINDLLELSRIEAGVMTWHFSDVALGDVIRSSLEGIMLLIENKVLTVTTAIEQNLPLIRGDQDRLFQVMTNIFSNAVKFTAPGGSIHVAARAEQGQSPAIIVSVTDTGIGIPGEDLKLVFDKFQRSGDNLTRTVEGTGLGLAIAKEIVEFHGGMIWAESVCGKGSTFTVRLPLKW